MNTKILTADKNDIEYAGKIIASGGLVAFPTETVYGLGADALNEQAVKKIYSAKGRPSDNPLIVHVAEKEDVYPLVKSVPEKAVKLMDAFFPGPLTIILEKSEKIGNVVSGGLNTVAVRMPENEIAHALIKASGRPVAAPSANTSGLPSPTKAKYVIDDMMGKIDAIIDGGDCRFGVESTVITLAGEKSIILRPGAVTKEMIEDVIGKTEVAKAVLEGMDDNETAASPGMKYKHYAPKARVSIVNAGKEKYETFVNSRTNAFALCFDGDNINIPFVTYGNEDDDLSQAKELFDALRKLDELGAKKVYARMPRKNGIAMAVYNRLIRAAAFNVIDLEKPFTIGLTGPTGAGKGFVCNILKKRGFKIIDSDYYTRVAQQRGSPLLKELAETFGSDIILPDGELNRALLADRAFSSKESTKKLNEIMHPEIIKLCEKQARGLCVLDAPQLFEAHAESSCYKTICVTAGENIRLERIMKRDGISKEAAMKRISAQHSEQFYTDNCDFVIYNDGRDIIKQIDNITEVIL